MQNKNSTSMRTRFARGMKKLTSIGKLNRKPDIRNEEDPKVIEIEACTNFEALHEMPLFPKSFKESLREKSTLHNSEESKKEIF